MAGKRAGVYSYNMADAYAYEHGTGTLASGVVTVTTGLDVIDRAFVQLDSTTDTAEFLTFFVTKNSGTNGDLLVTAMSLAVSSIGAITHVDTDSNETITWVAFGNKHKSKPSSQS